MTPAGCALLAGQCITIGQLLAQEKVHQRQPVISIGFSSLQERKKASRYPLSDSQKTRPRDGILVRSL